MNKKLFNKSAMYKPTPASIAEQNRRHSLYNYYGIPIGVFTSDSDFKYTAEELKAMRYIAKNRNIPADLEKILLETKDERSKRLPITCESTDFKISKEEEQKILERYTK